MLAIFTEIGNLLEKSHDSIKAALAGLPPEALEWTPAPGANSMGVLVVHLAGAQRYWIGAVAAGGDYQRDRAAEFAAHSFNEAQLCALLDDTLAESRAALAQITPLHLDEVRSAPRDGRRVTVAWAILHALEHTALHTGHIQVTRDVWQARETG
ncbi:MAG: hypothetical protein Kow0031_11510 [Anaerolineae bacterium]